MGVEEGLSLDGCRGEGRTSSSVDERGYGILGVASKDRRGQAGMSRRERRQWPGSPSHLCL